MLCSDCSPPCGFTSLQTEPADTCRVPPRLVQLFLHSLAIFLSDMVKRNSQTPVTLRDIAAALGLSHVTVSLALRDHPKIPEARRLQIQETARLMGYSPNA